MHRRDDARDPLPARVVGNADAKGVEGDYPGPLAGKDRGAAETGIDEVAEGGICDRI